MTAQNTAVTSAAQLDRSSSGLLKHIVLFIYSTPVWKGARCSSVVIAYAHGVMGRRIDPSWGGPIELFLVPSSAPRLV